MLASLLQSELENPSRSKTKRKKPKLIAHIKQEDSSAESDSDEVPFCTLQELRSIDERLIQILSNVV